jgi:hypothetical protein
MNASARIPQPDSTQRSQKEAKEEEEELDMSVLSFRQEYEWEACRSLENEDEGLQQPSAKTKESKADICGSHAGTETEETRWRARAQVRPFMTFSHGPVLAFSTSHSYP